MADKLCVLVLLFVSVEEKEEIDLVAVGKCFVVWFVRCAVCFDYVAVIRQKCCKRGKFIGDWELVLFLVKTKRKTHKRQNEDKNGCVSACDCC